MNRLLFAGTVLISGVSVFAKGAERPVVIPLKDVWAFEMPGTRDVRELELDFKKSNRSPLTSGILRTLTSNELGKSTKPAFAVPGTGGDALREAHAVLVESKKPRASFAVNEKLSVVFFSHSFNYYVHLSRIEQQVDKVVITYRFIPHREKELTRHFALIPLRKLPRGTVKVEIIRARMQPQSITGFKPLGAATDAQVVARPFQFEVVKE
jgi:hypothetical protein